MRQLIESDHPCFEKAIARAKGNFIRLARLLTGGGDTPAFSRCPKATVVGIRLMGCRITSTHTGTVDSRSGFIVAGMCGGVVQNTPYIGHPAYKAMGGRAAYVLATALFVGGAGLLGYFKYIFVFIPEVAVFPVLVFIGLEITGQSFIATPRRHYAALALAFIPALAKLIIIYLDQYLGFWLQGNVPEGIQNGRLEGQYILLRMLAGGFIISSLIWAAALAKMIDRKLFDAAIYFAIAGILTLFGVIHSPLAGEQMFLPWSEGIRSNSNFLLMVEFAVGYLVLAVVLCVISWTMKSSLTPINTDEEFEALGHH